MLLENALSEEIQPPQVLLPKVGQRDYTAEKDKTVAACSGAILTSLTSTCMFLLALSGIEGRGRGIEIFEGCRIGLSTQQGSSL